MIGDFSKFIFSKYFLVLLSLLIPVLFFVLLLWRPSDYIGLLYIYSPIILMLILLPFKNKYVPFTDIELYGGISSRFMLLMIFIMSYRYDASPLTISLVPAPSYGYTAPIEYYIPILLCGFLNCFRSRTIFSVTFCIIWSVLMTTCLYLLFWGRKYKYKAIKIFYPVVIALNIILIILFSRAPYYVVLAPIQSIYLIANSYRLREIYKPFIKT